MLLDFNFWALANKGETEAALCASGRWAWSHCRAEDAVDPRRLGADGGPVWHGPFGVLCAVLHGVGGSAWHCNKFKKD